MKGYINGENLFIYLFESICAARTLYQTNKFHDDVRERGPIILFIFYCLNVYHTNIYLAPSRIYFIVPSFLYTFVLYYLYIYTYYHHHYLSLILPFPTSSPANMCVYVFKSLVDTCTRNT